MSATKSDAIDIFTCQQNRNYLRTVIPCPKISEDVLQSMVNNFAKNYVSYVSNTQEMWAIVRQLNRLFVNNVDFEPATQDTYSSAGAAIFMEEEVNNGLNFYPTCGQGASQYYGMPWDGEHAGGWATECPEQPNRDKELTCQGVSNRFTEFKNKFYREGVGNWGQPIRPQFGGSKIIDTGACPADKRGDPDRMYKAQDPSLGQDFHYDFGP